MKEAFTDSVAFKLLVHQAFTKADEDSSGVIDLTELVVALCRVHIALNKGAPGASSLPTKATVRSALAAADLNRDGGLNLEEFYNFSKVWFKGHARKFATRAITLAIIHAVFIPQSAELIRDNVPGGRNVPAKLISLVITLGASPHTAHRCTSRSSLTRLLRAQVSSFSPRDALPRRDALCLS